MGRKLFTNPFKSITAGVMAGNLLGIASDCEQADTVLYTCVFLDGGALDGRITIEVSNDNKVFQELPVDPVVPTIGSDTAFIEISDVAWKYIRPVFTNIAGTGTLDVTYKAHSRGA